MSVSRRPSTLLAAAVLAMSTAAPSAHASGRDLWVECRDTGTVGANHSPQDYADAIAGAPGDGAEYTPCLLAIKAAQQQSALKASGQLDDETAAKRPGGAKRDASPQGVGTGAAGTGSAPAASGGVTPAALGAALAAEQLDPSDYPGADGASASGADGTPLQLGAVPESSIGRSLSLPLPIAALSVVGLLWIVQLAGRVAVRIRS